jgi:eukaryotic-like serine/threonine-protein kinase
MSSARTPSDTTLNEKRDADVVPNRTPLDQGVSLEADVDELPPEYELLEAVGEGGMGVVFKARHQVTNAILAIKVMLPEIAQKQKNARRFLVEAKAASSLKHPNICKVFDFGATDTGLSYLVMDWIDGISLGRKVIRDKRVPPAEAIRIFQQIAAALAHAHEHKVIHRDLKPENIMLTRDSEGRTQVTVVDFGIAKMLQEDADVTRSYSLTSDGMVMGTPMYMSPEQARSNKIDGRSDIYSLGCVMYFTLTGEPPFIGETGVDTIARHINEPPPPIDPGLNISLDLARIVLRSLEKKPEDRYQTMHDLFVDLKKLSKGVSLKRRPLSAERQATRKKAWVIACFVIGFILMYAISLGLQNWFDATSPHNNNHSNQTSHAQSDP